MEYEKPLYDMVIFEFLENDLHNQNTSKDRREYAIIVDTGLGYYELDGKFVANTLLVGDVIRINKRDCIQVNKNHYMMREKNIL